MVCRAAPAQVSQRPRDYAQVAIRVRPLRTVACVTVRGTEEPHVPEIVRKNKCADRF